MRETASKSGLLLSPCLRWAHPAAAWYQDRPEDAQKREDGKSFHHCLDLHIKGMPYAVPGNIGAAVRGAARYWDKELKDRFSWVRSEQAMGIGINSIAPPVQAPDGLTDRAYPQDDNTLWGTADIVGLLKNGQLYVGDWKTGESDGAEAQLMTLAYMAVCVFNPIIGVSVRISCLKVDEDGVVYPQEREVSWGELVAHYDAVRTAIKQARSTAKPSLPVVGSYCVTQYCPHLAKCPAHVSTLTSFSPLKNWTWTEEPESPEHAAAMAHALTAVKRITKYYDGYLKDWVKAGGRVTYDGRVWEDRGAGFRWYKLPH